MPTYKPITLKMSTAPAYGYTSIKQMDVEGVELILTLRNTDDSDYNLTSGSTLFFKMANESGNVKVTLSEMDSPSNITRDGANVVKVLLTESMVSETGIMACELQEMHSGTFTSSQLFYLRVWPTTEDGEIIDSHEYKSLVSAYLAIDNALNVATLAKNYSESTITEENARQANEVIRISNEQARIDAENLRGVEVANARGDHATLGDRLDEMDVGIEGNASDLENTKLKVVRLEQEVKRYKELYEQSNPTQSPRLSSDGYGVVSLPKNAANGQVSLTQKGLTANNLLGTDGDFANGTAELAVGWQVTSIGHLVPVYDYDEKSQSFSGRYHDNYVYYRLSINNGHKYYIRFLLKKTKEENSRLTIGFESKLGLTLKNYIIIENDMYTTESYTEINKILLPTSDYLFIGFSGLLGTYCNAKIKDMTLVDLTELFGAGNEPTAEQCKQIFNGHVSGTKSTVGAMRLKSVSADETETSTAYVVAKDEEGKIAELRSLPNGTKDEINVTDRKLIKRIGEKSNIANGTVIDFADMAEGGTYYAWNDDGETEAGVKGDTLGIDATTLIYQLAEPVEIPIQVSGSIASYPSGTIYIERILPDAGVYTDKITILHQGAPIKRLDRLSKVDFYTGVETELDVSEAVIAEDKLSFTHPDLSEGDIVFFEYEYDVESTEGETEVEYYDSRYVIKDSVTDKFYRWHIIVADGVPSIELVEV